MTSSSARMGYLPVLAELKSLLKRCREVVAVCDAEAADPTAARDPSDEGATKARDDRSIELPTDTVSMVTSFMVFLVLQRLFCVFFCVCRWNVCLAAKR